MSLQLKPFTKSFPHNSILRYDKDMLQGIKALENDKARQHKKDRLDGLAARTLEKQEAPLIKTLAKETQEKRQKVVNLDKEGRLEIARIKILEQEAIDRFRTPAQGKVPAITEQQTVEIVDRHRKSRQTIKDQQGARHIALEEEQQKLLKKTFSDAEYNTHHLPIPKDTLELSSAERVTNAMHQVIKDTDKGGLKVEINGKTFTGRGAAMKIIPQLNETAPQSDGDLGGRYTLYSLASKKSTIIFKNAIDDRLSSTSFKRIDDDASDNPTIRIFSNSGQTTVLLWATHTIRDFSKEKVAQMESSMTIILNERGRIEHSEVSTGPATLVAHTSSAPSHASSSSSSSSSASPSPSPAPSSSSPSSSAKPTAEEPPAPSTSDPESQAPETDHVGVDETVLLPRLGGFYNPEAVDFFKKSGKIRIRL